MGQQVNSGQLVEQLAQKSEEVSILRQISSQLNSTLKLEEIFDIVQRTMDELFGFNHSIILLPDRTGETLTVV